MENIDRRSAIKQLTAFAAGVAFADQDALAADSKPKTGLGIVMYDCMLRRTLMKKRDKSFDLYEPFSFLRHCRSLGAGGAHVGLDAD
jgi:hypothetical protein